MKHRNLKSLLVSLPLSLAALGFSSLAGAVVAPPTTDHRWTFDEPDGTVCYDDAGGPDGNMASSTTRALGPSGTNAVTLTPKGVYDWDSYVDFGNEVGAFGTADFTVTHWYRTSFSGVGVHGDVLGNREDGSYGNYFSVRVRGTGEVGIEICEDEEGSHYAELVGFGHPVNDGEWHHLAYVRSGAHISLYIDGALVGTGTAASGYPAYLGGNSSFRIGRRLMYTGNFYSIPASYDDLRIYSRALSDNEIFDIATGAL
jgi:hypothetical protein